MSRRLDVLINEEVVGELREENDLWQLEYGEAWRSFPRGFDLSSALHRGPALHIDGANARPVQWYFDKLFEQMEKGGEFDLTDIAHFNGGNLLSAFCVDVGRS